MKIKLTQRQMLLAVGSCNSRYHHPTIYSIAYNYVFIFFAFA